MSPRVPFAPRLRIAAVGFLVFLVLLLESTLHQVTIAFRVLVARRAGQSRIVSGEGVFELARVGEGVAAVILRVGILEGGQQLRSFIVFARLQLGVGAAVAGR